MSKSRGTVRDWVLAVPVAIGFLTRIPLPGPMPDRAAVFRRSTVFFPLAGLLIGCLLALAGFGLGYIFPFYVNAVLTLALWVCLTGGLHLDGLMDTADGLLSNRSRERMLDIMKDSRSGAMGVITAAMTLLVKAALLGALLERGGKESLALLVIIPVWSRAFLPMAIAGWPYARLEQGMGGLYRSVRGRHALAAGCLAALVSYPVVTVFGSFAPIGALALIGGLLLLTYVVGAWLAAAVNRKLGGLTGDVYGALNECLELVLLLGLVALVSLSGLST